ncbi:MAG: PTS glucose transporter subunit IIA [Erysipelotrichaceae bacterium]|nr:PTS glucose transporter subunit IIA [Erysipelotrichaceae bacterium]
MGLFDFLKKKEVKEDVALEPITVDDEAIVALADGKVFDIAEVADPVFSQKMMGDGVAFSFTGDKTVLCAPANGTLTVLFPTGHAFGITANNGVEILVHCGIDTVNANGDGFKLLGKKQGDVVKAGEPIVQVDLKKLSANYDMSTMLIITNANGKEIAFVEPKEVKRGEPVVK